MTLSKAEKTRRAETRAANAASKSAAKQASEAVRFNSDDPSAKLASAIASPAIRSSKDIPDTGTVTVACKMPTGLILRLFTEQVEHEPVLGGGTRPVKVMRPNGPQVRVYGYAVPVNKRPKFTITGTDFALTENVDAKFFKTWWEQNKDLPVITTGLIWCMKSKADADDKAEDMTDVRNGLEAVDPKGDARFGKSSHPHLEDISATDKKSVAKTV